MAGQRLIHKTKDRLERLLNRRIAVSSRLPFLEFQKRFLTVMMDVTTRCNLKCFFCLRSAKDGQPDRKFDMDDRLLSKIADQIFTRTSELFLACSSEPLMAKNLDHVLDLVGKAGIPFVAFSTNGMLFDDDKTRRVIAAGINEVYVSFDGATDATFARVRGGASIDRIQRNIRRFNELKKECSSPTPRIELHTTLMRSNIEEIERITELAHELRVDRLTAFHLAAFPHLDIEEESLHNHQDLSDTYVETALRKAEELGVVVEFPPLFREMKASPRPAASSSSPGRACPLPWNTIIVWADGRVFPCNSGYEGHPLGNLSESSFSEIWYGSGYQAFREQIRTGTKPKECALCNRCGQVSS